jgi:cytochrome c553
MKLLIAVIAVVVLGVGSLYLQTRGSGSLASGGKATNLIMPDLSEDAQKGAVLFAESCSACHGSNAQGTDNGPTFVHQFYVPGHHGDYAFQMAAKNGVRAHHWNFGDMPPVEGVTDADVTLITRFIREVQFANGIR